MFCNDFKLTKAGSSFENKKSNRRNSIMKNHLKMFIGWISMNIQVVKLDICWRKFTRFCTRNYPEKLPFKLNSTTSMSSTNFNKITWRQNCSHGRKSIKKHYTMLKEINEIMWLLVEDKKKGKGENQNKIFLKKLISLFIEYSNVL